MLKVQKFILQNAFILLNCLEALVPFGQLAGLLGKDRREDCTHCLFDVLR